MARQVIGRNRRSAGVRSNILLLLTSTISLQIVETKSLPPSTDRKSARPTTDRPRRGLHSVAGAQTRRSPITPCHPANPCLACLLRALCTRYVRSCLVQCLCHLANYRLSIHAEEGKKIFKIDEWIKINQRTNTSRPATTGQHVLARARGAQQHQIQD